MSKAYRTVEARPNAQTLVKPGELVDLVEVTPLTLADRRIYNQLLENAWDAIEKPVTHVIAKSDLRGSHNSNDRVGSSIERLMACWNMKSHSGCAALSKTALFLRACNAR